MISKFVPGFVSQGIIDHDYTMLAMRRYAESSRHFWANIIKKVKSQHAAIIEPISQFQKTELKNYKDCRKSFENAQTRYDNQLSKYLSFTKNKEPSALREDAFQLAEARTAYTKASFELCTIISLTQAKLDICLVRTLSEPWILSPKEFASADSVSQRVGVEMLRLRSWAKAMQKSYKPLTKEMEKAAKDMEQAAIERLAPSRDLNSYYVQNSTIPQFVPQALAHSGGRDEKHGWLMVKSTSNKGVRQIWVRRWIFVKNGMFGWLNISPSKTFVQESDKIGVLLCHVTPVTSEDRRFCFEIKTKDTVLFLQAETLEELRSWLQVFEDAKRLAIESDKKTTISYAFQRFPPMITEFASTAGTSVDVELTHEKSSIPENSGDSGNPSLGNSISLLKNSDITALQALMVAGESLVTPSTKGITGKVAFSSVGPFGSALAPSPLLNIPMPTSMSQEAILSTSLVVSADIPTAVTANYWGSVNWALYQKAPTGEESTDELALNKSKSRSSSVVQLRLDRYPSYYPPELRSQDAQLSAIFQNVPGQNLDDKVVLVFRCLFRPNPTQQLPTRVYITSTSMYLYSHCLGMIVTYHIPLKALVSVEGRTGLHQDTLFLISSLSTLTCNVYLDSGRTLQKRIQFLIDNCHSEEPLGFENILQRLISLGSDQKEESLAEEDIDSSTEKNLSPLDISLLGATYSEETRTDAEKRFLYLYMTNYLAGSSSSSTTLSLQQAKSESPPDAGRPLVESVPDMSKLMTQLSAERDFDIPAKALFHIMFGETSPVFRYSNTGSVTRTEIELSAWKLINSHRMEREIYYNIKDSDNLFNSDTDKVMNLQRLEQINDNYCYIVYERHAVVQLPQGLSFYTTHRYVITKLTRNSCKLSIWSSVEWIKSSILKNMTEPYVLTKIRTDAKIIVQRSVQCRRQLGSKGSTTTAIRVFGKIGTSVISESVTGKSFDGDDNYGDAQRGTPNNTIIISHKSMGRRLLEICASITISLIGEIALLIRQLLKFIWIGITSNKILILGLLLSCAFNLFLMGRSSSAYWMERHAQQYADQIGISPDSHSIMARSILLKDVDILIRNGSGFSVEADMVEKLGEDKSTSLCYNKFRSLALLPNDSEEFYSIGEEKDIQEKNSNFDFNSVYLNSLSPYGSPYAVRNRIFNMRNKLGTKRNSLMIELRSINRIESELVMAEWQSWLYEEVSLCSRLAQMFSIIRQTEGSGLNKDGSDGNRNKQSQLYLASGGKINESLINLMQKTSLETRQAVSKYCQSCSRELASTVKSSQKLSV